MSQCIFQTRRRLLVYLAVAGLLLVARQAPAEPVPGKHDRLVTQMVCYYLQNLHLRKPEIGEEVSKRLFNRFLKTLDPAKLYFLKSDIDEFKGTEGELGAKLLQGDMTFAYKVYERFAARVAERVKLIEELVKAPHDFTVKESMSTDYDALDYANSADELRERWRKRIKFDLLQQRLDKKPLPEAEAKQKVLNRYRDIAKRWKQLDNYELMELYLTDLTTSIDPHSTYMGPTTLAEFDIAMRLHLDGIGALLGSESGNTIVKEIVPGGAAAEDGRLKPNDKIIGVAQGDDKFTDVIDMKLSDVVKMIRGRRGTKVQLKVVPADKIEPVVLTFTRRNIELKSQEARAEIVDQGKKADGTPYKIGVIDLPSFYSDPARNGQGEGKSATEDVRKILKDFNAKNVDGVVLDLRRDGGGALSEALALTGLFIDQGPVVQVKDPRGKVQQGNDPEKGVVYGGPLMVLTSRLSASASEILAGALQDYGRALVVGDTATHGKGTVQQLIDLGSQVQSDPPPKLGALKLTIQQFYRVNGDSTQNRGVTADVVVPSLTEYLATGEKDLDYALEFDKVDPAEHDELGLVTAELKAVIKTRSGERVKNSKDFQKLIKEAQQIKARRDKKQVPLNEKELKEQFSNDEAEKAATGHDDQPPETPVHQGTYKLQRNFTNNEVLNIMEDLIQGKKLLTSR
jgi:carboxyl-terminal processing protease